MSKEEKLELAAGDYALSHRDADKTYTSLEVHAMLAKAFIDGQNWKEVE